MAYDCQTGSPILELERGQKQPNRRLTRIAKLNNIIRDTDLCRAVDILKKRTVKSSTYEQRMGVISVGFVMMLREPDPQLLHDSVPSRY